MKKILLKLSGESLGSAGVDASDLKRTVHEIATAAKFASIVIVIGGGNIWRFRDNKHLTALPRIQSDYLGMSATVFNAVTLSAALKKLKIRSKVFSAVRTPVELADPYSIAAVKKFLAKKGVAILAGGTGKPLVTTDSGAAMRAAELNCDLVVKATNVNGIYDRDPRTSKKAQLLEELDYKTAIKEKLGVMDIKAFHILGKHNIPTRIFNFSKKGLLRQAVVGKNIGSLIY